MDAYQAIRSLSFPSLASALGIHLTRFKQRSNGEWYGPCPIHESKTNQTSFSYHPDGRFNCFSCSAKGRGGVDLTMKMRNCGFKEAVAFLGAVPPEQPKSPPAVNSDVVEGTGELKPYSGSYEKFKVACPWLEARIPDASIRERYGVFAYDNPKRKSAYSGRVMLPVKDAEGTLYGYLGRNTNSEDLKSSGDSNSVAGPNLPKYLFPKNLPKSKFLFGGVELAFFGSLPLKRVFLVESPFCVMKFASLGLPAVSPYGWSVSADQIEFLAQLAKGIVHLPDRDKYEESGHVATLLASRLWLRRPSLPEGCSDPEKLSREQILAL